MAQSEKVFVAGANGMVGRSIVKHLNTVEDTFILQPSSEALDLRNQRDVVNFFQDNEITSVYFAAARVGGIHANNTFPAEFIYDNLIMIANVIHAAHQANVPKLLFLGSSCIYPKYAPQPMSEDALMTGVLEPTNEPYAIAKIAGIKLCESYNRQYGRDYRSVMPTNLYGPFDNFHPENSHVVPALLRRFHEAKSNGSDSVAIWGSGNAKREFLYVDDMASASVFLMNLSKEKYQANTDPQLSHLNIGIGDDCSIRELAETISNVVGYKGAIVYDDSKPDGPPRKLLETSKVKSLGWVSSTSLKEGLAQTYNWWLHHQESYRR